MTTDYKFDYDEANDTLFIYRKSEHKVKGSLDVGNFIIDITHDNIVSGLEILDTSEVMENLGIKNPKEILRNIKNAQLRIVFKKDSIVVYYVLLAKLKNKEERIGASIAVPVSK